MPILKLLAENVGPFDKLELDLTDGNGNAHLGPHILAGVNGSGKTTVLKAIARSVDSVEHSCAADPDRRPNNGFDLEDWRHLLAGKRRAGAHIFIGSNIQTAIATTRLIDNLEGYDELTVDGPFDTSEDESTDEGPDAWEEIQKIQGEEWRGIESLGCVSCYAPHPALRWMERPPIGLSEDARANWLSFRAAVSNDDVQAFWVASFSRESLLKTRGRENGQVKKTVDRLRAAIYSILGPDFEPDLNIDVTFPTPMLRFRGADLNFTQLAAGFNATLGWVVDYLLRQEFFDWPSPRMADDRPGVILIDEIETHLHPQWQRRILNGIRAAFPNTQIIVTTHSPFVVSSCPGSRLHLFKVDDSGRAYLDESMDAPEAATISANIMDVFGIRSEFSWSIEQKLDRWNELKRKRAATRLPAGEEDELKSLIGELAAKGEELSSIVAEPPVLPQSLIDELVSSANKNR